ncbi:MAG: hypothetical protein K2W96_16755, partial [Gemmataceae bacterium]|nr:hypothetical protein [Gemmataceae bacterium]
DALLAAEVEDAQAGLVEAGEALLPLLAVGLAALAGLLGDLGGVGYGRGSWLRATRATIPGPSMT